MGEGSLWSLTPVVAILIAAALPTHIWRWMGVLSAGRLSETSELFVFVKAVATALVAALIAKLILFPTGPLTEVPTFARAAAAALGFAAFLIGGRRLAAGIVVSEMMLALAFVAL